MDSDLSCWVVRKNRQYLVAVSDFTNRPKFSPYAFDAVQIKNANEARAVADKVGGNIHKFNPLNGEVI